MCSVAFILISVGLTNQNSLVQCVRLCWVGLIAERLSSTYSLNTSYVFTARVLFRFFTWDGCVGSTSISDSDKPYECLSARQSSQISVY